MDINQNLMIMFTASEYIEFIIRIILCCICGAAIGLERSKRYKEAGIRTHIIVCCASGLIMIVSKYCFIDLSVSGDPERIAAQVISGISFLGAGVIFKNGNTIKGLTTAAGIWATAGIGLALGSGMYLLGIFVTVVIAILQIIMHKFQFGGDSLETYIIKFECKDKQTSQKILDKFIEWNLTFSDIKFTDYETENIIYNVTVKSKEQIDLALLQQHFSYYDGVCSFSVSVL